MHANSWYGSQSVIKHPSQHPCTYQVLLQLVQPSDKSGSATWLNRKQHFSTIISLSQLHLRAPNEPARVVLSAWLLDWCSPDPATSNSFLSIFVGYRHSFDSEVRQHLHFQRGHRKVFEISEEVKGLNIMYMFITRRTLQEYLVSNYTQSCFKLSALLCNLALKCSFA